MKERTRTEVSDFLKCGLLLLTVLLFLDLSLVLAQTRPGRLPSRSKTQYGTRRSYPEASGRDINPCIRNVRARFNEIRTHGDKLGFYHSQTKGAYKHWDSSSHYQGIQRLQGKYLVVSGSTSKAAELLIVEMGSRSDKGRLRSNRLASNKPPSKDRVVKVVKVSQRLTHAGGIQALGDYLVVGVEGNKKSEVVFYNLKNPLAPVALQRRISRIKPAGGFKDDPTSGAVAIVKRTDGLFLLLVGRYNSNVLDFYLSTKSNLQTASFDLVESWHESELRGMDREFGNYQNINFIRQCDGQLFFVGLHKEIQGGVVRGGRDWADLFKLDLKQVGGTGTGESPRYHVTITKIANRHMYCRDICDFDAGAGVHVDEKGGLFIYGIEHWRHNGLARFNEFRPVPASVNPPLKDINGAWVELYDDHNFGDRSVMIDYVDRKVRKYTDYDMVEGFEDKTSSVKWLLPEGWQYLLFEDKHFKGRMLQLSGTGRMGAISNLKTRGWGDKVSSSKYSKERITNLNEAWVELFDDVTFKDRRLSITGSSKNIRNYKNIWAGGKKGFGDKVSSARYMIPRGYVYRLYQHDSYRGKTLDLVGTGKIEEISNFKRRGFNDATSSSRFRKK